MIYLQRHSKSYIHAIYGPTDTLLYNGVDKLITSIDLVSPNPTFSFVQKRSILGDLGVSEDQFLDIGILLGFDHSLPFPPTVHDQALKATVDMVKYYKSGHAAVSALADQPHIKQMQYPEHYARTRSMIKYSLILSSEGSVTPLPLAISSPPPHAHPNHHSHHPTAADIPTDLHEIFTHRLPDEVYFYLSRGLLGPQALVWLTTGQIIENPPLDNGETTEYRRFIKEVITDGQTGPRVTSLALISSAMHNFWQTKKVVGNFWFDQPAPQKPISHNSQQTLQLTERVGSWNVPSNIIEEELRRQNVSVDLATSTPDAETAGSKSPSGPAAALLTPLLPPSRMRSRRQLISAFVSERLRPRSSRCGPRSSKTRADSTRRMRSWPMPSGAFWSCAGTCMHFSWPRQTRRHRGHAAHKEKRVFTKTQIVFDRFLLNHTHSPLARAMYCALRPARVNDKFQDSLYLFLELVRAGVVHGHLWSGRAFSGGPSFGTGACLWPRFPTDRSDRRRTRTGTAPLILTSPQMTRSRACCS